MIRARAAFLLHLEREKGASPHTIRAYGKDLEQLEAHLRTQLGREARPADVDVLAIRYDELRELLDQSEVTREALHQAAHAHEQENLEWRTRQA